MEEAFEIVSRPAPTPPEMLASALGHWEFSEARVIAGSSFVRAVNHDHCEESFGTHISPSSFADFGMLGPAVLRGPPCKAKTDWDQSERSFSVLNFLTNNGRTEALQVITDGLTVAEDITRMTSNGRSDEAQLPSAAITVSTWMSPSGGGSQAFSALVAAAQAGPKCNGGFVLGYTLLASRTVLQFDLGLPAHSEQNHSAAPATFVMAYASLPRLEAGSWYHVAASYDGSTLRLYLDGDLVHEKAACGNRSSCGEIVYPTAFTSPFCTKPTALTLGSYTNQGTGETSSHFGWVKEASIFDYPLTSAEIKQLYSILEHSLKSSPIPLRDYWVAFGESRLLSPRPHHGAPPVMSPSKDFAFQASTRISVFGAFYTDQRYSCRFTSSDNSAESHVYETPELSCRGGCQCPPGSADSLTCIVPKWDAPAVFATAHLSIIRLEDDSDLHDHSQPITRNHTLLWQRLCLQEACGFVDMVSRGRSSSGCTPWWATSTNQQISIPSTYSHISPLLVGTRTSFRFLTNVKLLWANATGIHLLQDVFGRESTDTTALEASFDETRTQGASSCTLFHSNVTAGRRHLFLAVTNFWDLSHRFQRKSSIFRLSLAAHTGKDRSSEMVSDQRPSMHHSGNLSLWNVSKNLSFSSNNSAANDAAWSANEAEEMMNISYELIGEIDTHGARKILHFTTAQTPHQKLAKEYLAVANLFGASYLYPWTTMAHGNDSLHDGGNTSANPAPFFFSPQTHGALAVPTVRCATDVTSFSAHGTLYLVFAVFLHDSCMCKTNECLRNASAAGGSASQIFTFDDAETNVNISGLAFSMSRANLSLAQNLAEVTSARQVVHMEISDKRLLVFAGEGDASSVVYVAGRDKQPVFVRLQKLPSSSLAVSLFTWGGTYLVATRASLPSLFLRWDGESFLGAPDETTLPRSTAGGQLLPTDTSYGALHLSVPANISTRDVNGETQVHFMLIGSGTTPRLFRGFRERVQGLKGLVDIKLDPDGLFLYAAAEGSRSIAAFRRNSTSGLLTYAPLASYNTDWTAARARAELVINPRTRGEGGGYPLRGIAALEISRDGFEVVVASMLDSCVVVFERNELSGALSIRTILTDGDELGGRVVDGLAGARSVAISATNRRLYVSGWRDQVFLFPPSSSSRDATHV